MSELIGRSLDMWVAEQVFGWKRGARWANGNGEWYVDGKISPGRTWEMTPKWSQDIGRAWEVVEHLRSQGWTMTLSVNHYVAEPWDCRLFEGERRCVIAHGATAPEAISRAALLAVAEDGTA